MRRKFLALIASTLLLGGCAPGAPQEMKVGRAVFKSSALFKDIPQGA